MEHAVNKNPSKDPGDVSDSSSAVDFPPQTMITWLLVSVAVGLVTIYTMIQFISNKLTKEIKGKKTEGQKNTIDLHSQCGTKQNNTLNYVLKTPQDSSKESEERGKVKEIRSDLAIQYDSGNAEKPDFNIFDALENGNVERLETNQSLVCEDTMERTKCQNHETSVHMGTGFSGNLSIETEGEKIKGLTCDERSKIGAEHTTTCRSIATLKDYILNHNTPVTVNNVQLKCFSCNAKIPRNDEVAIHQDQQSAAANNHHSKTCSSELNLNFLSNYHTPRDTTDGLVVSKNTTKDDQLIFTQDNEATTEKPPACVSNRVEELETPRSRYLKSLRNDPVFSKSLDSQMEVLKKGCKLLETKPLKSSLRRPASSEGNLEKFVHFPEDIRNIRTVHKYISFDELWRCADAEEPAEKQRTQTVDK